MPRSEKHLKIKAPAWAGKTHAWEVCAYMPNHGQHYGNQFKTLWAAMAYHDIQMRNPSFELVVVHKVWTNTHTAV